MLRYIFIVLLWPTFVLAESYRLDPTFPQLPKEIKLAEVSGVTINSSGEIFIFHRGQRPIIAMDKSGKLLRTFGEGTKSAHGLRCDSADNIWATDVMNHTVPIPMRRIQEATHRCIGRPLRVIWRATKR